MTRADGEIPETAADDEADAREEKRERSLHWRRVRRRFLGAAAVVALIGLLWQLGDDSRPPQITPVAPSLEPFPELPPNASLQDAASELEAVEDFTPAPATVAAADAESVGEDAEESEESETPPESGKTESAKSSGTANAAQDSRSEKTAPKAVKDSVAVVDGDEDFFAVSAPSSFAVQVAAFGQKSRALRLARKLRGHDFAVKITAHESDGTLYFRVRAVGYAARADAELARQKIIRLGYPQALLRDQR